MKAYRRTRLSFGVPRKSGMKAYRRTRLSFGVPRKSAPDRYQSRASGSREKPTEMHQQFCQEEIETVKRHLVSADAELLPFTCVANPEDSFFYVRVSGCVPCKARTYMIQAPNDCAAMRVGVRRFLAVFVTEARTVP
jgi:hypothetical protein